MVLVFSFLIGSNDKDDCETCVPAYVCDVCEAENADKPEPSLAGLFTILFAGLTLVGSASALVLEDKTTQNLRFMTMSGVKPIQYLVATTSALFILSVGCLVLFSAVGGYFGVEMLQFLSVTAFGALVSILLGIAIGLSKYPALAFPFSMVLGMGPMLSSFNDTLGEILAFTYTQQVRLAVSDLGWDMGGNFGVIGANGLVILVLFGWMHRKGQLRW
jgi:hypothetical protein